MPVEHIRVSKTGRDQLITLRRRTGIDNWNILCRLAFCRSIAEPAVPPNTKIPSDGSVEMTWRIFAGQYGDEIWAILRQRCHDDGFALDDESLANQFRLHLHRGLGYLVGDPVVTDIAGLTGSLLAAPL